MSNSGKNLQQHEPPTPPCTIHRKVKYDRAFDRRGFMKMAAGTGAAVTATSFLPDEFIEAKAAPMLNDASAGGMKLLQAACPYCGVGCGTLIKAENGKVVGMVPTRSIPPIAASSASRGLTPMSLSIAIGLPGCSCART